MQNVCRSVKETIEFYTKVLGFVLTKRPSPSTLTVCGSSTTASTSTWCSPRMRITPAAGRVQGDDGCLARVFGTDLSGGTITINAKSRTKPNSRLIFEKFQGRHLWK